MITWLRDQLPSALTFLLIKISSSSEGLADRKNHLLIKNDPLSILAFHQYIGHANNDAL